VPSALTIWVSEDMSEQINDFNGEYFLITIKDMKRTSLGHTLDAAKEKLKELGRYDIAEQLR
jgi:hypothetical protein